MTDNDPVSQEESVGSDEISEHKTRRLRIATWNMDHWKRNVGQRQDAWEYMCAGKLAQVVLLQECVPPAGFKKTRHAYREIGGSACPLLLFLNEADDWGPSDHCVVEIELN